MMQRHLLAFYRVAKYCDNAPLMYWNGQAKEILGVPTYLESYTLLFIKLMKALRKGE